jgi:hypothetical protein
MKPIENRSNMRTNRRTALGVVGEIFLGYDT